MTTPFFIHRGLRPDETGVEELSPREEQVLDLYIRYGSYPLIAEALGLSPHTVKKHASSAIQKCGVATVGQAAVLYDRAVRQGRITDVESVATAKPLRRLPSRLPGPAEGIIPRQGYGE